MPEVEVYIQNRDLSVNRRQFQYSDLEVVDSLNDARTCKFSGPITDTNALNQSNVQHFLPLARFVKVIYRDRPIFWGPVVKPVFNFAQNRVEVNCIDPSIWMMNHHLDTIEAEDNDEIKVNGAGLEDLLFATYLTSTEFAAGFQEFPSTLGVGEDYFISPESSSSERRTQHIDNGTPIFDAMQQISSAADGPDWAFLPIDERYDPYDHFGPGFGVSFIAVQEIGTDKQDEVIFHYGFGRTNLENFTYEPDGALVRNRHVVQNGRGRVYRVAKYGDGMQALGIMEGWETGDDAKPAYLAEKARLVAESYGDPLPTFTIEPTWDQGLMGSAASTPWRYPTGYTVGDRIRVQAKLDRMDLDLVGRVTKVTLTQLNAAENVKSQIECIPQPLRDLEESVVVEDTIQ